MHNVLLQEIMRLLVKLVNTGSGVMVTVDHSNPRYCCLLKTDAYGCWVTAPCEWSSPQRIKSAAKRERLLQQPR
jgi:hypothetical protein